jgi:hypothetical protein
MAELCDLRKSGDAVDAAAAAVLKSKFNIFTAKAAKNSFLIPVESVFIFSFRKASGSPCLADGVFSQRVICGSVMVTESA